MIPIEVIAALGGFAGGAITALLTVVRWVLETRDMAGESLRLLKGSEQIDGDGIIEIVQDNRRMTRAHRRALNQSDAVPHPRKYE